MEVFVLLKSVIFALIINGEQYYHSHQYEWLDYPQCPNIDCKLSIFEFCAVASIGNLVDQYIETKGFLYNAKSQSSNTKLKVALNEDTESIFCSGLNIRRHLLSLMNTQNPEKTGVAVDILLLLEKTELHKSIRKYSFWPKSYHMSHKKQRRKFFNSLSCNEKLNEPWIFKTNEHKGKGIVFLNDTEIMRKLFITNEDLKYAIKNGKKRLFPYCDPSKGMDRLSIMEIQQIGFARTNIDNVGHTVKGDNYIAQQYVADTLLINGHKFGIRMFIVLLSLNPFIVLYSDGYISINAEIYNAEDINKLNVLSNREISANRKSNNNNEDKEGEEWNWSYQQFEEYLQAQKEAGVDFDINHVRSQLIKAANLTMQSIIRNDGKFSKSTRKKLKRFLPIAISKNLIDKKDNNYIWLAIDFLLTVDGNVKLLEINLHPGTRFIDHCSWFNINESSYNDWQCQQGRNISKEIVDITFEMAYRKKNYIKWNKKMIDSTLKFHKVLLYRDF